MSNTIESHEFLQYDNNIDFTYYHVKTGRWSSRHKSADSGENIFIQTHFPK